MIAIFINANLSNIIPMLIFTVFIMPSHNYTLSKEESIIDRILNKDIRV